MAKFIELNSDEVKVFVNTENIISVHPADSGSVIRFIGDDANNPVFQRFDENYIVIKGKILSPL